MQLCAPGTGTARVDFCSTDGGRRGCRDINLQNVCRAYRSQDQRAVLEAVYAIEKLPDAALRDRLSAYLSLTSRQIQVSWCDAPL